MDVFSCFRQVVGRTRESEDGASVQNVHVFYQVRETFHFMNHSQGSFLFSKPGINFQSKNFHTRYSLKFTASISRGICLRL